MTKDKWKIEKARRLTAMCEEILETMPFSVPSRVFRGLLDARDALLFPRRKTVPPNPPKLWREISGN